MTEIPQAEIINNTELTIEQIEAKPLIGREKNMWRERNVTLHQSDSDPDRVYAVGRSFNGKRIYLTHEPRSHFALALRYWANGEKTHVSE